MRKRDTPLEHPRRLPYLRGQIPGIDHIWTFRLPRPRDAQKLIARYTKATEEADDEMPLEGIEEAVGLFIGAVWADEVYELENEDPGDIYGELYDAGWSLRQALGIVKAINEAVGAEEAEEIRLTVDFSERPEVVEPEISPSATGG